MQPKISAYRQLLLDDPAIEDIIGYIGGGMGVNNAFIMIKMKPLAERKVSSQQVIERLRANLPPLPGGNLYMWVDQDIRLEGAGDSGKQELQLLAADLAPLREWAPKVSAALKSLPELVDVEAQGEAGMRQVVLDIDREAAARHGVDLRTIATVLNNSFSQRQVATLYDTLNQYRVVMELDPRHTQDPTTLQQLTTLHVADGWNCNGSIPTCLKGIGARLPHLTSLGFHAYGESWLECVIGCQKLKKLAITKTNEHQ